MSYLLILVGVMVVLGLFHWLNVKRERDRQQELILLKNQRQLHDGVPDRGTIGVIITGEGHYKGLIQQLFDTAYLSQRIHLHVSKDRVSESEWPFVTVLECSQEPAAMFRNLRKDFKYVLFLSASCQPCLDWDVTCTRSLNSAYAQGGHAVTLFPFETSADAQYPATFPVFFDYSSRAVPIFKPRFLAHPQTTQVIWVSHMCLFVQPDVLGSMEDFVPGLNFAEADLVLSLILWYKGLRTYSMDFSAFVRVSAPAPVADPQKIKNKAVRNILQSKLVEKNLLFNSWKRQAVYTIEQFWVAVGLNPIRKTAETHSRLGLFLNHQTTDIIEKYGNMATFAALNNSLKFRIKI